VEKKRDSDGLRGGIHAGTMKKFKGRLSTLSYLGATTKEPKGGAGRKKRRTEEGFSHEKKGGAEQKGTIGVSL